MENRVITQEIQQRAGNIRLAVFDVDGVLTDGRLFLSDSGDEYKVFHTRDGHGLVMLRKAGIELAIISGRTSRAVAQRMTELGMRHVHQGVRDKVVVLEQILADLELRVEETAYMGDDLPDLPVMRKVGLAVAVADAHGSVRQEAHWVTTLPGGQGAVRELCDLILSNRQYER